MSQTQATISIARNAEGRLESRGTMETEQRGRTMESGRGRGKSGVKRGRGRGNYTKQNARESTGGKSKRLKVALPKKRAQERESSGVKRPHRFRPGTGNIFIFVILWYRVFKYLPFSTNFSQLYHKIVK